MVGRYFIQHIDTAHSFEELRRTIYAAQLKPLVKYLLDESHHPALLNALLYLHPYLLRDLTPLLTSTGEH